MTDSGYDVLVIGGGPGGISAACKTALGGKRVVIVNDGPLMGYGIDGAFRSKAGFEISREYLHAKLREPVFGAIQPLRIENLRRGVEESAASLTRMLERRLERIGIDLVCGRARFVDSHTIEVDGQTIRARYLVIATGTRPRVLPGMTVDGRRVLTSDEVNDLDFTPDDVLVLGAGVIGCEYASLFASAGARVRLVDTQPRIMANEDPDVSQFVSHAFDKRGIEVIRSSRYQGMAFDGDKVRVSLKTGEVTTSMLLLSIGRVPNTDGLNLEAAGVALDQRGYVATDEETRSSVPHIFAVGDIGQRKTPSDLALVHVAEAEGRCAASHILQQPNVQGLDHIPYIIFTVPMLAGAGLSETQAREAHGDVRVGKYPYGRNHRAHAIQPPWGFVKLIVGPEGDDRVLGVRAVGPEADGIVTAASIIIERELPFTYLLESILPHPSLLECLKGCAHIIAGDLLSYEEGEDVMDYNS